MGLSPVASAPTGEGGPSSGRTWPLSLGVLVFRFVHKGGADPQLFQFFHEVPVLVHLQKNVAAPHKLAVEVHLRDGGPVGIVLNA